MRAAVVPLLALAAAQTLAPLRAAAQSANELVQKNLAARGGEQKLAAIDSIRFSGKLIFGGNFELTYQETRARKGNAVRFESSLQGLTLVQAYDGSTAWRINPFNGRRDAERMSADDTSALADDATIDGVLLSARSQGSTVSYLGREDFDGTDAYKLRVTKRDGSEYTYYLDPDTFLEIKIVETRSLRGARQVTVTELGDYELVDGVYFPFEIVSGDEAIAPSQRQKITIENAQANVPVSAATFAMPGSK